MAVRRTKRRQVAALQMLEPRRTREIIWSAATCRRFVLLTSPTFALAAGGFSSNRPRLSAGIPQKTITHLAFLLNFFAELRRKAPGKN
jgi:hypothetical protein